MRRREFITLAATTDSMAARGARTAVDASDRVSRHQVA